MNVTNLDDAQNVGSHLYKATPKVDPWYVTGFSDGEGCFSVTFTQRAKLKTGVETRASFSISQNKRSLSILKEVRDYFGCGAIRFSKADQTYKYEVRSTQDLRSKIIPHFEKYPLQTSKRTDFELFREICDAMAASKHLNKECLKQLIEKAYTMNEGGTRRYTKESILKVVEMR